MPEPEERPHALVTGGSRRLGRAIAEELARARVRRRDLLPQRRERAPGRRSPAWRPRARPRIALQADLGDADACERLIAEAEDALGPLDLLVNNAAMFERTPLDTMGADDFDSHLNVNARSVYLLSLHAGRRMKERGRRLDREHRRYGRHARRGRATSPTPRARPP